MAINESEVVTDESLPDHALTVERGSQTVRCCDWCGSRGDWYPLREGAERCYVLPPDRKYCDDCAELASVYDADCLTDGELIAAIVGDSRYYASPQHAAFHVEKYRKGKQQVLDDGGSWCIACERGMAVFKGDIDDLIESAVRYWARITPKKRETLLEKVEEWRKVEENNRIASMGISMLGPVGGL